MHATVLSAHTDISIPQVEPTMFFKVFQIERAL
jgi:hypothetical protein